jgi:hypothetical protein
MATDLIYASGVLLRDLRNEHAVPHTSGLFSRHPDPPRITVRQRIARILVALGGRIASLPPGQFPART